MIDLNHTIIMTKTTLLLGIILIATSEIVLSQSDESSRNNRYVSGTITTTNNGISLIPTFTLSKPAVMFDLALGNKKLSFEPYLRFALDGKPWFLIFWWRYQLVKNEKFQLRVGSYPAIGFKSAIQNINGQNTEVITAQRYLAGEIAPNYFIRKNISVGLYYLHSSGIENYTTRNYDFITLNCNFSHLRLTDNYFIKFNPQVYFLKLDQQHGYYATAAITLARKACPLSLQAIATQAMNSSIVTKSNFVWNVSLIYSFKKNFLPANKLADTKAS